MFYPFFIIIPIKSPSATSNPVFESVKCLLLPPLFIQRLSAHKSVSGHQWPSQHQKYENQASIHSLFWHPPSYRFHNCTHSYNASSNNRPCISQSWRFSSVRLSIFITMPPSQRIPSVTISSKKRLLEFEYFDYTM